MDSAKRNGKPIAAADAWVAATALHLGVQLIAHNRNHFIGVDGLTVISESGR
jgi:predicted nucleic acid-binding protein